ncbi:2-phosphosulfolactate phosphatase [Rhodococcus sp. NPDC058532]|uniref:2-phosphosulfolactate phosphatase n=1 Tax=Rhodococcus sp. NPDC058532 TaxID=3346540 RepID=UPI0036611B4E
MPTPPAPPAHRQGAHRNRFDWGPAGAAAVAVGCDVAVVVDVLSFSTTLTVALEAGAVVLPYPWDPAGAAAYAADHDATPAVGRSRARPGQPSLSPLSLRAGAVPTRLVLPSPNGSALSFGLATGGSPHVATGGSPHVATGGSPHVATGGSPLVVGACLRNASAVARWIASSGASTVAVIAAGERWPDGSLRPAVEDLWGAGAVLRAFAIADPGGCSPESLSAAAAFDAAAPTIGALLDSCAGGRELAAKGFGGDVAVAAEVDVSAVVPVLRGIEFVDAATEGDPA